MAPTAVPHKTYTRPEDQDLSQNNFCLQLMQILASLR